jgi:hypothetical protein
MRIPFLFLYFSLVPLFLFSEGDGDMEWKLVKQQKGISVYIRSIYNLVKMPLEVLALVQ